MSSSNRWTGGATVWENKICKGSSGKALILRSARRASSEAKDEGACTLPIREVSLSRSPKKLSSVLASTGNSPFIHRFSTLDRCERRDYAWNFMTVREFARVCLVACVLVSSRAAAADDATDR